MTTPSSSQRQVTQLLDDWRGGDSDALDRLIPPIRTASVGAALHERGLPELPTFARAPPRKDRRGVDLISDVLPFGWLLYTKPYDAIG
jgi:hypothetical protein